MMIHKNNQIIAKEGILNYQDHGRVYKPWSELRKFIGAEVRVLHTHDGEEVGKAKIKQCPIGKNLLCADIEYDSDKVKEARGYSIGTLSELDDQTGSLGSDTYSKIQRIKAIDHIALTDAPRDTNALSDSIISEEFIKGENKDYITLYDSFEFIEGEKKMGEESVKKEEIESIKKMYDELKSKYESISSENSKMRDLIDSFEKSERERLVSQITKKLPNFIVEDSVPLKTLKFGVSLLEKFEDALPKPEEVKDQVDKRPIEKIIRKIEDNEAAFDPFAIYKTKEEMTW